jgi:hypothetical protein
MSSADFENINNHKQAADIENINNQLIFQRTTKEFQKNSQRIPKEFPNLVKPVKCLFTA